MKNNKKGLIYYGDCLDVLENIPSNSIDLIVTSPPYAKARMHSYGGIHPDKYVSWFSRRALHFHRVLKPTGSFVLNIKEHAEKGERHPYVADLVVALRRFIGFCLIDEYIWCKENVMPGRWTTRFRDGFERVYHFAKEVNCKFNQESVMVPIGTWAKRLDNPRRADFVRLTPKLNPQVGRRALNWKDKEFVYPTNVLHMNPVNRATGHSAAFPDGIPEFFIKLLTDKKDIVLDPFAGSGTTGRVAGKLDRKFIMIDIFKDSIKVQKNDKELMSYVSRIKSVPKA